MNHPSGVSGRRRTPVEAEQIVAEFESSGLSRSEFCRGHGLAPITLNRYQKRVRPAAAAEAEKRERGASDRLLAVELAGRNERSEVYGFSFGAGRGCGVSVMLSSGRRIEVGAGFDGPTLQRLIKLLETM